MNKEKNNKAMIVIDTSLSFVPYFRFDKHKKENKFNQSLLEHNFNNGYFFYYLFFSHCVSLSVAQCSCEIKVRKKIRP